MRAARRVPVAELWVVVLLACAATARAGADGEPPPDLSRVQIVVRGDADITLTDPAGRVNAMTDTGLVNRIPECRRIPAWRDPIDTTQVATAFEIEGARAGLYAVRVRARSAGSVRVEVTATPQIGEPCSGADAASLKIGERLAFSIAVDPLTGEGETGCVIRAGHRLAAPPSKKKKS